MLRKHLNILNFALIRICFGSFRVSFDLTAPSESFFYDAMPVVSIVFFKDLEDHLKTNSSTGDNSR